MSPSVWTTRPPPPSSARFAAGRGRPPPLTGARAGPAPPRTWRLRRAVSFGRSLRDRVVGRAQDTLSIPRSADDALARSRPKDTTLLQLVARETDGTPPCEEPSAENTRLVRRSTQGVC